MPSLVIVESPAKARTISSFLGKGYKVMASMGHVRDLPRSRKELPDEYRKTPWADFGVNVDQEYDPIYIVPSEKKKVITELRKALKEADELLLATDEDREGESISWHLLETLKPPKKLPVRRIVFHEITRDAIQAAIANPRDLDMDLVHAQEGRRIVDRLFGYKLSPILWRKVQPGLSAGRVQSVAVRLIVEREEERRAFVTSEYWDLEAEIGAPTGPFKASLQSVSGQRVASGKDFDATTGRLKNQEKVTLLTSEQSALLARALEGNLPWSIDKVEDKPGQQSPSPPFTTSTLQQEANRKLGFGAQRTMRAAQRLYEGVDLGGETVGLITYMRTDSVTLSEKALKDAQTVIRANYGADYAKGPRVYKTKTRNAQEAHEAIRPTEMARLPQDMARFLNKDEAALYELIWKRTLASQMPNAQVLRTSVEIGADAPEGRAVFSASGKKILFPGYLRAYVEGSDDPAAELGDKETILPDLQPGQQILSREAADAQQMKESLRHKPLHLAALAQREHHTQPPARYTEASLVKKLEEEGVGRPSTYASIISTIQDRGYVNSNKSRQLVPTYTAMIVTSMLRDHFAHYVDLKFTARMEEQLDEVSNGAVSWVKQVDEFYRGNGSGKGLEGLVEEKQEQIGFVHLTLGNDPDSGEEVQVRVGKYGPYIALGANGAREMANVPADTAPADLTLEDAIKALRSKSEGPRHLGFYEGTGEPIYAMTGRFGDYVQLGETPEEKKAPKPRRQSVPRGKNWETVTLEEAQDLLQFPKELGAHPESGEPVLVNLGKYGPYVQHQRDFRSLKDEDVPSKVTLERALQLLAEPKGARAKRGAANKKVLKDLGDSIQILEGRYGPYATDGKTNATLPKSQTPEAVTLAQAKELIEAKAAKGGGKQAGTKKPAAKKSTAKKTSKKKE